MRQLSKTILGIALTTLIFMITPYAGDCVTYPEVITLEDLTEDIPVKTETRSVTIDTFHSDPRLVEVKNVEYDYISDEDTVLLALLTMAEAEGESEEGKRLVIDTVLNRVDSEHFPNTISEVIYQNGQFTSISNGRVDRVAITKEVVTLIEEEVRNRTNSDVMFFRAKKYSNYGVPMFSVGNHYFSSYD